MRYSRTIGWPMPATVLFMALATVLPFGCASSTSDTDEPAVATADREQNRGAGASVATDASSADSPEPTMPAGTTSDSSTATHRKDSNEALNDAQILGVLKITNESEVATSQLAAQKATTPEVRDFAHDMIQDHLVAGQYVDQTTTQEPPGGSELATTLIQQANQQLESLSGMSGADFDRAYLESQVTGHQDLLESIESDLLPQADAVAVRQLLESMRETIGEHLEQARELRQQLSSIAG